MSGEIGGLQVQKVGVFEDVCDVSGEWEPCLQDAESSNVRPAERR